MPNVARKASTTLGILVSRHSVGLNSGKVFFGFSPTAQLAMFHLGRSLVWHAKPREIILESQGFQLASWAKATARFALKDLMWVACHRSCRLRSGCARRTLGFVPWFAFSWLSARSVPSIIKFAVSILRQEGHVDGFGDERTHPHPFKAATVQLGCAVQSQHGSAFCPIVHAFLCRAPRTQDDWAPADISVTTTPPTLPPATQSALWPYATG